MLKWSLDIPSLIVNPANDLLIRGIKPVYLRLVNRVNLDRAFTLGGEMQANQLHAIGDASCTLQQEINAAIQCCAKPLVNVRRVPTALSVDGRTWSGIANDVGFIHNSAQRLAETMSSVDDWEFENEPDVPRDQGGDYYGGWGRTREDGARYGVALRAFADGIKSVNPNAVVWSGGLMSNNVREVEPFLDGLLDTAQGAFDVFALHGHQDSHYRGGSIYTTRYNEREDWYWSGIEHKYLWFVQKLSERGMLKPISFNECAKICSDDTRQQKWGTCSCAEERFEIDQLVYAGQLHGTLNALGAHSVFWYHDEWQGASLNRNGQPSRVARYLAEVNR